MADSRKVSKKEKITRHVILKADSSLTHRDQMTQIRPDFLVSVAGLPFALRL